MESSSLFKKRPRDYDVVEEKFFALPLVVEEKDPAACKPGQRVVQRGVGWWRKPMPEGFRGGDIKWIN